MKNNFNVLIPAVLVFGNLMPLCFATDFDPLAPPASSVFGAGGDNTGQVTLAIQQSKEIAEDSKHVNVLFQDGATVLRGNVKSDRDRQTIGNIAEKCGCTSIKNELKVVSAKAANMSKSKKRPYVKNF